MDRFKSVHIDAEHKLTHNYRHIQPLNDRALVYVKGFSGNGAPIKSVSVAIVLLTSIVAVVGFKY